MATAKKGDLVFVHYTGKFDDGEVFDSSVGEKPLFFIIGDGDIIAGFETAVLGMSEGEKKSIVLTPEQGYGEYSEDRIITVPLDNFGDDFEPAVGLKLALQLENGERVVALVTKFDSESLTLDMNHELAGKTLHFELELISIRDASEMPAVCGSSCSSCSGCGH